MYSKNLITLLSPLKICINIFLSSKFWNLQLDTSNVVWIISITMTTMMLSIFIIRTSVTTTPVKPPTMGKGIFIIIIIIFFLMAVLRFIFIIKPNTMTMSMITSCTSDLMTNTPATTTTISKMVMKTTSKTRIFITRFVMVMWSSSSRRRKMLIEHPLHGLHKRVCHSAHLSP
ncbi:hypothetical protein GUJ93_ZPchr0001g32766 [Zizania palustris]|uniref:Uncharacterized protein n=1 Tax=Zizania palustris TaxID=103762 RepID=A0A8J5V781_ZIZPA|nr:hypothetical protein GUJ93_ZPchr0001g32766 [Zizania palustris]